MKKVRLLVFGDTHLKYTNVDVIEQFLDQLPDEQFDYIVHLGDFWDKASGIRFEDLQLAAKLLKRFIASVKEKVFIVKGNHDVRKGIVSGLELLEISEKVYVADSLIEVTLSNNVRVALIPYGTPEDHLQMISSQIAFGHLPLKGFRLSAQTDKTLEVGIDPTQLKRYVPIYFGGHHHCNEERGRIVLPGSVVPTRRGESTECYALKLEVTQSDVYWEKLPFNYEVSWESSQRKSASVEFATPEDLFDSFETAKLVLPTEVREALVQSCSDPCVRAFVESVLTEVGTWS